MQARITEKRWYIFLKMLFGIIPLVVLTIQLIILMVLSTSDGTTSLINFIRAWIIPMGIEILLVVITKFVDDYFTADERGKQLAEMKNKLDELSNDKHLQIKSEIKSINRDLRNYNNASIEILTTHEDFYTRLAKSRQGANSEVLLTQLDPWPPNNYEEESIRKSYFNSDVEYIKQHPNISVYRILSIESKEKLEWVESLIKATKSFPNFFLAYVDINSIEKSTPFPKMLSLQIIDEEEVFCLNPQFSYMPRSYKPCYCFKNKAVAKLYVDYYKKVWDVLCADEKHGCILKDGRDISDYEAKLNAIKAKRGW